MIALTDKAIDVRDLKYFKFLSNLQGNILKGHGRDFTNCLFIKFAAGKKAEVRKWLNGFAEAHLTSAIAQLKETEVFKRNKISGGVFTSICVSASGYKYLEGVATLPPAFEASFIGGMKHAQLNDPLPATWDQGFNDDIHAMILIADVDPDTISNITKSVIGDLHNSGAPIGTVLTIEYGTAIRNSNGDGLEHFGYVDGISQPLFLLDDITSFNASTSPVYSPPSTKFDPSFSLDQVLVHDPFVTDPAEDAFGSYFVFRKLEQKVRSFKTQEKVLGQTLGLQGEDTERAGAMIIGRFEDGTPVTLSDEAGIYKSGTTNNFDYTNDTQGAKCPFHAHIRKSNPRRPGDQAHTMARRGITYGGRGTNTDIDPELEQMPAGGVGLLFQSFQRSISNQFEFIQKNWINAQNFPGVNSGIDPLIGQTSPPSATSTGKFAKTYNNPASLTSVSFPEFISLKGGEYFFAPSLAYFSKL